MTDKVARFCENLPVGQVWKRHDSDLGRGVRGRSTGEGSHGCRSGHGHTREGGNFSATSPRRRPWKRSPLLARSHTRVQTPTSCSTSVVNGTTYTIEADEEREVAVMQEKLTLFEHESKFSEIVPDSEKQLRREPCFPETCLNDSSTGPETTKNLDNG